MDGESKYFIFMPLILVLALVVLVLIVILNAAERRIPVQYAKRVVGRKMYGGQNSHIPIKVNMSGVMPIIFASTLAMIPTTIAQFFPNLYNASVHPVWSAILGRSALELGLCRHLFCAHHRVQLLLCGNSV